MARKVSLQEARLSFFRSDPLERPCEQVECHVPQDVEVLWTVIRAGNGIHVVPTQPRTPPRQRPP